MQTVFFIFLNLNRLFLHFVNGSVKTQERVSAADIENVCTALQVGLRIRSELFNSGQLVNTLAGRAAGPPTQTAS